MIYFNLDKIFICKVGKKDDLTLSKILDQFNNFTPEM
jgi:hypothetical protein